MNMKPRKVLTGNGDEQEEYPRIHESADREEAAAAGWEGSPPVHHAPRRIAYLVTWNTALLVLLLLFFLLRACKRTYRSRESPKNPFEFAGESSCTNFTTLSLDGSRTAAHSLSLSLYLSVFLALTSYSRRSHTQVSRTLMSE